MVTSVPSFGLPVFGVAGAVSVPNFVVRRSRRVAEMMPVVPMKGRTRSGAVARLVRHAFCVRRVLATVAGGGCLTATHGQVFVTLRRFPSPHVGRPQPYTGPHAVQPQAESARRISGVMHRSEFG